MAKGSRYPAEFKAQAVSLYRASARPHREIASELGIAPETLRRWMVRADIDGGSKAGLSTEEREELRRLRREVRTLHKEHTMDGEGLGVARLSPQVNHPTAGEQVREAHGKLRIAHHALEVLPN